MMVIIVERSRMINRLLGGMNFIEYTVDKPKEAYIKKDYDAPVCKVHVTMRDPHGNKLEDTTTLGNKRDPWGYPKFEHQELIDEFITNTNLLREQLPLGLDNKTYSNFKIISVEILNEWTENDHYFERVVFPQQD
jgi:hypothetical protein